MTTIVLYCFFAWVLYRLVRLFSTPVFKKIGVYRYYSPFLFAYRRSRKTFELHLGTAWDHLRNPSPTMQIHIHALDGLLGICEDIKTGRLPANAVLKGTMHFLNNNSLLKLGFKAKKLSLIDFLFFMLSYPEVILMKFIISGKFRIFSPFEVRIITCSMGELFNHRENIKKYRDLILLHQRNLPGDKYQNVA